MDCEGRLRPIVTVIDLGGWMGFFGGVALLTRRNHLRRRISAIVTGFMMCMTVLAVGEELVEGNAMTDEEINDPFLWLEEVGSEKALAWVEERNAETVPGIESAAGFAALEKRLLSIYHSNEKIPYVTKIGEHLYNFWQDAEHVRGIMRRTTLASYRTESPEWETVIDVDALGEAEGESWVWKGWSVLEPEEDRALVRLSRGGGDAVVIREFDLHAQSFVEGGFVVPEAKSRAYWLDRDTLLVGSDFGPGTMTTSGYPRTTRIWSRGTSLKEAEVVFEGQSDDVAATAWATWEKGRRIRGATRSMTFYTNEEYLWHDGGLVKLDKPLDAETSVWGDYLLIHLRTSWIIGDNVWPAGALLSTPVDDFLSGGRDFTMIFEPAERTSLDDFTGTRNYLLVTELENVRSRVYLLRPGDGTWERKALPVPAFGTVSVSAVDSEREDAYWMVVTDFLTPSSLYLGDASSANESELLKQLPDFFKADGLVIDQFEATSADGTKVPYFIVMREDLVCDGSAPTLLSGYGGFEVSLQSSYSPTVGAAWLERGGVFVRANIRGGGEFGPAWHQAALKENRQRAYEDFIAIAKDLIARGITSAEHLGITGGSNGGLLTGNMLVQRPDLFGAVVSAVPLLDMRRYHKLLAGASWIGEYGDPDDPEEWAFLERYSPYHQVREDVDYPPVLFTTSTRDDRVHPAHARKMVARMRAQGHDEVFYYENTEGGHGMAADLKQAAFIQALEYTWLWQQLADDREQDD